MKWLALLLFGLPLNLAWFYGRPEPNAWTEGGVWPLPQSIVYDTANHTINPGDFRFSPSLSGCDVLDSAVARYRILSFPRYNASSYNAGASTLTTLLIQVRDVCPGYPQLEMDESYNLTVTAGRSVAYLSSNSVWGALRGLETFAQLIFSPLENQFLARTATIGDFPRFPHRGILIDSSRHFLPVGVLLQNLDLMAQNKMNVFHWHLVDSEAFPYTSAKFPNLSAKGAYSPRHAYSVADMKKVIEYARLRGVRVVAEFDTPGHTGAWGPGQDQLLSKCYDKNGVNNILANIIDPTIEQNFDFLADFFTEALTLFPDNYMHFGGDEVSSYMLECWQRNPDVQHRMQQMNIPDTAALLNYYFQRLWAIIDTARNGTNKIVWQEVLDLNVDAKGTIAHVWTGDNYADIMAEMDKVTNAGHRTILSSCWYLNYIKYGADWGYLDNDNIRQRGLYYECNPTDFGGTAQQRALVLGGEAAIWGEFVDGTNLIPRLWPRVSAVAERLWSDENQLGSADSAWPRLHEHRCRMVHRGFPVQPPNNPDYCPFEWDPPYVELP